MAVWRTFFAAASLAPFAFAKRRGIDWPRGKDLVLMVCAGVLLGLHFVFWIESLYLTTVASASVLVTTTPVFVAVLGFVFLKERLGLVEIGGIVLGVLGAGLIGLGDAGTSFGSNPTLGNSLALLASVVASAYMIIGRVVRQRASWLAYVFPLYAAASLTTLAVALIRGVDLWHYSPRFYGLCLLMAVGPQVLGHGSFNYALKYISAATLGLLTLLEPVGATSMAYVLFDELPGWVARVGILIVLLSVTLVVFKHRLTARRSLPADGTA